MPDYSDTKLLQLAETLLSEYLDYRSDNKTEIGYINGLLAIHRRNIGELLAFLKEENFATTWKDYEEVKDYYNFIHFNFHNDIAQRFYKIFIAYNNHLKQKQKENAYANSFSRDFRESVIKSQSRTDEDS